MENKIVHSYDIHCDECGKYLFTINEIMKPDSSLTYETRENDIGGYAYLEFDDIWLCADCLGD